MISDQIQEKSIRLENLEKQKSLQQDLAKAQLEQLMLKQRQLELLEAKLAALEAAEQKRSLLAAEKEGVKEDGNVVSEREGDVVGPLMTSIQAIQAAPVENLGSSSITLIEEEGEEEPEMTEEEAQALMMQEMMNNPEFREKIAVLQKQSQELAYLEDQLSSLKDLKQKMMEKQELMAEITQEQVNLMEAEKAAVNSQNYELMQKVEEILEEASPVDTASGTVVEAAAPQANTAEEDVQEITVLEPLEPSTNNLSELEAATNAMERYLTFQQAEREKFNSEPSASELADEAVMLESLMQRLMNASVFEEKVEDALTTAENKKPDQNQPRVSFSENLTEFTAPAAQVEEEEEEEEEIPEEIEAENDDNEVAAIEEDTAGKIEYAIKQLAMQIEEVKDAEKLITTPDERIYFDSVLSKMTGQLEELLELREKVAYYEELITLTEQQKLKEENAIDGVAIAAESSTIPSIDQQQSETSVVVEEQKAEEVEQEEEIEQSQISSTVYAEKQVQEEPSALKKSESVVIPSTSDYIPFPASTQELREYKPSLHSQVLLMKNGATRRAPSSVTDSISRGSSSRSKKLFQKHKTAIYESASTLIEAFESKPHFLLTLFKKLPQFADSEASQQQLLLFLDELVEETQMEQFDESDEDEEIDTESELLKSFTRSAQLEKDSASNARHHLHVGIQTFIASLVIASPSSVEFYSPEVIQTVSRHVCSLIYTELTSSSTSSKTLASDTALGVVEEFKPVLASILEVYAGSSTKENWTRLVDDLYTFMCQCLDWNVKNLGDSDENVIVVQA